MGKRPEPRTSEATVAAALARSGGQPPTPADNRRRIALERAGAIAPRGGNSRGENGKGTPKVSRRVIAKR